LAEKQYFHLERRFRELTDAESAQPDALEAFNESLAETGMTWTDLLTENRLVVLAEAGSGKTDEMRHQAQRLAADGKYAFFSLLNLSPTRSSRCSTARSRRRSPAGKATAVSQLGFSWTPLMN